MRYEATFLEKAIFVECYITDRNINLMGIDWIDAINLIQFSDENETFSRTHECGKSCGRTQPVSTCCRNLPSSYSYSIAETRFLQDSALTYHSRPTKGVTCTTVINSYSKGFDITLLSPTTSRSAISNLSKLVVYQKRSLRTQIHSFNLHFAYLCSDRESSLAVFGQSAPQQNLEFSNSRTACDPPDVMQRSERNNQDIISMYHQNSMAFLSSLGRSRDKDGREYPELMRHIALANKSQTSQFQRRRY
ncbi:hypothetical protein ACTXT7_012201 [Hymenolepis weldensis]